MGGKILSAKLKETLERLYRSAHKEGSLGGPRALLDLAHRLGHVQVTLDQCKLFLTSQDEYTLYKQARRRFRRRYIRTYFPGELLQWDLASFENVAEENHPWRMVFCVIDSYSRFVFACPVKNKKVDSLIDGFEECLRSLPFTPVSLLTDKESAIMSSKVQAWLKNHDINHWTANSSTKAPMIEKWIRWLRRRLSQYSEFSGHVRWVERLPLLVSEWNMRKHSVTRHPPLYLANDPLLVWNAPQDRPRKVSLPSVGSFVRISRLKPVFEKESAFTKNVAGKGSGTGTTTTWSREVFRVVKTNTGMFPPMVYVEDLLHRPVKGGFYVNEVQELSDFNADKRIANVYATRVVNGRKERFCSFVAYPSDYFEWV